MSKIIGNTTTTPVPRSDFLQNDKTKADYILNKPTLGVISTKNVVERNDLSTDVQSHLLKIDTKANVLTVTTEEYDAIVESGELNANTLYALTDDEENVIQADLNQNDSEAPDYVKGRTHWVEVSEEVILDNVSVDDSTLYSMTPVVGETYTIIFDGVEYKRVCNSHEQLGCYIGNVGIIGMGEDNGDPFFIAPVADSQVAMAFKTGSSHTMTISGISEIIHKIDEKYLPVNALVGRVGDGVYSAEFNAVNNVASGDWSHAEGIRTTASGQGSHAEGRDTIASGDWSHAEGYCTTASGWSARAEGRDTIASSSCQHVQGKYNIEDTANIYSHIVGNGSTTDITNDGITTIVENRSNAHTLDWEGNAWYQGDIYIGSTSGTNKDEGSKKVATEEYVDNKELITIADIDAICGASINLEN